MPIQQTLGNASSDGFGGGVVADPKYVEDYFQTMLRTGTGSSVSVTNGLDASANEALVWVKSCSAATDHKLTDTVRGATKSLISNSGNAQTTDANGLTGFNSTGYTLGNDTNYNNSGATYVDWEFVATPKFFDVVTYTGNGSNRTVAHNLGSVPGSIIVKRTDTAANWQVYHRSLANTQYLVLNNSGPVDTSTTLWNSTTPTSTVFSVGTDSTVNANGGTYVAYLFAHDAGGFGLTGTDNVISCGMFNLPSYTDVTVTLGYEPQWLLVKNITTYDDWRLMDVSRGMPVPPSATSLLYPNSSAAEQAITKQAYPTATGFVWTGSGGWGYTGDHVYIAIRRGPMKVPTSGTSVFAPVAQIGEAAFNSSFIVDLVLERNRTSGALGYTADRLRGRSRALDTTSAGVEFNAGPAYFDSASGTFRATLVGGTSESVVYWAFRRAPGFFDEVCYTGTGVVRTVAHNLGVAPELIISKPRDQVADGCVYSAAIGDTKRCRLFSSLGYMASENRGAGDGTNYGFTISLSTASTIRTGAGYETNRSGYTYVAYLFATYPGVSKVGSYTGTGTTQQINCGFTGGARFVLIKRTDSTGDWYVWDTARGIVSGNDPYLLLNSSAAEVASTDYIDTYSAGFEISSTAPAEINASSGSFIYLAIA